MKKAILTTIQIFITVGILFWIFHDPQKRHDMFDSFRNGDKLWIMAGILAFGIVELLATWRWKILLEVQGISLSFPRVLGLVMIGILFNLLMPGGTGGDVIKIFYLLKEIPEKRSGALLAVLMDRLIGLLGLIAFTALIMIFRFQWLGGTAVTRNLTWVALLIMGASVVGIAFSFLITGFNLAHRLPPKFPARDKFIDLSIAYSEYARAWKSSLSAFLISLGVHFFSFYVFFAAARAMKQSMPMLDLFGVMPIINTITSLPISVGGAGVREKLFADMLGNLCGTAIPVAYAISITGYLMLIFWAIVGGMVYLLYRPSDHARLGEMAKAVHDLEHKIAAEE